MLLIRFRRLMAQLIQHLVKKIIGNKYDLIPKGQYDYVPKGTNVFGPADRFLLVPKNRYRAKLLPDQIISAELGIGWITEDNSSEGYDQLWGDSLNLQAFRSEADHVREKLAGEIIDFVETRIPSNANVIDIGCGIGDLLAEIRFRKPDVKVSGLDFSFKAVEGAQTSFPDGNFIQYKIEKILPYESLLYDVVFCTDVIEHLEYPRLVIAELLRICKPEGFVVIVVPDGDIDQFLGHYWFWSKSSLEHLLAEWEAEVVQLKQTRELLACIHVRNLEKDN